MFYKRVVPLFIMAIMVFFHPFTVMESEAKTYRIGYIEIYPFWAFDEVLINTKTALKANGWLEKIEFPDDAQIKGGQTPYTPEELEKKSQELFARKDLDLIISAGTPATAAILKANNGSIPIIAIAVSDPLKSGFVKNAHDSGIDNFTARVVLGRYEKMFTIFHDVVQFKTLGLMHDGTENGKKYTHLEDAYIVSKMRGFKIIEYNNIRIGDNTDKCIEGLSWLLDQGMDAFFIPALTCFDWKESDVKKLIDFFIEHKIPTFGREGSIYVKSGALMGFSGIDWADRGKYVANKIIKIFEGVKPRDLTMLDNPTPKISFNTYTADKIGMKIPIELVETFDEIFYDITLPENRLVK